MAQTAQPARAAAHHGRSAWGWLLTFFALFCTLVAAGGYGGWRYYTSATAPLGEALLRTHVQAGVIVQERGRLAGQSIERLPPDRDPCPGQPDVCTPIVEGSIIRTQREAGYGPVASLVLPVDRTQIDFWAHPGGAELVLERYRATTWSRRHMEVLLSQRAGYLRYDVAQGQPYESAEYTVEAGDVRVRLQPGGSYSINVPVEVDGSPIQVSDSGLPLRVEVAARRGTATVEYRGSQVAIAEGELIQIDGGGDLRGPLPAGWQIIRDGDFAQYRAQGEYGSGSQTWHKLWTPNAPGMTAGEMNGRFTVVRSCRPETPDLCAPEDQVFIGQFRRDGRQTRPFTTGIEQTLDADVSEYTSLRLSLWVRVLSQTVPSVGMAGSECPIMIQLIYKPTSPTDQQQNRYYCIYTDGESSFLAQEAGEIRYRQVPPFQWYRLDVELRDDTLLRQARYLQMIRIEARGHDYLSEIAALSLVGRQ